MSKCNDCKNYRKKEDGLTMGRCAFPLPYWFMSDANGGGFVHNMVEIDCDVFSLYEQNKNNKP